MSMLREKERIYLSKRKGFVKVAMQAGADIVPVYILGQSKVNTQSDRHRHAVCTAKLCCSRTHGSKLTKKLVGSRCSQDAVLHWW